MVFLFAIFTLAVAVAFYRQREISIGLIVIGVLLSLAMFWYHSTSTLQINW